MCDASEDAARDAKCSVKMHFHIVGCWVALTTLLVYLVINELLFDDSWGQVHFRA